MIYQRCHNLNLRKKYIIDIYEYIYIMCAKAIHLYVLSFYIYISFYILLIKRKEKKTY